jgi:hypothetical protein
MTFVGNGVLTAAQLNAHLRDNLNETAPALAANAGGFFVSDDANSLVERVAASARATNTSTTSTSYTGTSGPTVTVTTGSQALVFFKSKMWNTTSNAATLMSVEVSGASTITAVNDWDIQMAGLTAGSTSDNFVQVAMAHHFKELTPGSNTFQCKMRVGSGTGGYDNRQLMVWPL